MRILPAVLVVGVCLAGCLQLLGGTTDRPLEPVTLKLKWTHAFQFAGYYAAQEQGYYREAGLEVRFEEAVPAEDPVQVVLQGKAQYGVGTSSLLILRNSGKPVVVLAVIFQHSPYVILARPQARIQHIHDLLGKRVMIEPQADELQAYLKKEGISLDQLSLVKHSQDPGDLLSGRVDAQSAYLTQEPYFFDSQNIPYLALSPRSVGIDFYGDNLFTTEHEMKAHPNRVKAFREASLRGWTYAMAHPEELVDLILARYSNRLSRDQLLFEAHQMTALMRPDLIEIGYMNPGRWRHIKETYVELGMLNPNFSLAGFLYDATPRVNLVWTYRALAAALLFSLVIAGIAAHYRRLTRALKTSEERHRLLADNAADVIWTMDLEGRFTYVSPSVTKLRGYTPAEVMVQSLAEALTPESVGAAQEGLGSVLEAIQLGQPVPGFRGELEQPCKDGSTVWTEVTTTGMTNEDGKFVGILGVTRDITDRKVLAAEKTALDLQNRQLEKAKSLGLMAASIAHHFNNKLQAVMANLEVLSELPKGADPTKYLAMAKLASEKAAAVSRQMLVYLGNSPGERNSLFLGEFCATYLPLLQQALPSGITLEGPCPSPGPVIKANTEQLQQTLANLVTNASEAMGATGGCVRMSISTCRAAELPTAHRFPIGWQPQGSDYACLEIADTGIGIASEDIEKLFDPFFSTKFTGRGLGLSVVLGLVQAQGGALTVASQLGHGSVFRVYMPVSTEEQPTRPEPAGAAPKHVGGGTLLLVDDDEMLLESACALIKVLGFTALTAQDGVEALEVFRQHQASIRCVLTDLTMPRLDGWGLLSALRQLDPNLPVILASGYDKAQILAGTHPDHPQAFLSKPFGLQQLRDALGHALVTSSSARS